MRKGLTEMIFILDRSGSMLGMEKDVIDGFNTMIRNQQQELGEAYVTAILFDNYSEFVYDRVPVRKVRPLTQDRYYARGSTAILDALGGAVNHLEMIHSQMKEEDVPEHTVFVITADGMENASRHYSVGLVRNMIEGRRNGSGWEFLFLGANMDAVAIAEKYGIDDTRAVRFHSDGPGTAVSYKSISSVISRIRSDCAVDKVWKEEIEKDYQQRTKERRWARMSG